MKYFHYILDEKYEITEQAFYMELEELSGDATFEYIDKNEMTINYCEQQVFGIECPF